MTFVYGFIFETFEEKFMNVLEFIHIIFFHVSIDFTLLAKTWIKYFENSYRFCSHYLFSFNLYYLYLLEQALCFPSKSFSEDM